MNIDIYTLRGADMKIYRWFYKEQHKASISGIVVANNWDTAVEYTKGYLSDQFADINGNMHFIISEDASNLDENNSVPVTLWVWEIEEDDDYHYAYPNCIAVSY